MRSPSAVLSIAFLAVAFAGCLDTGTPAPKVVDPLAALGLFEPICVEHVGPAVNNSTGRVADVCNVGVAKGPKAVNEPSLAVNPMDALHLVGGANDYGLNDVWCGVYVSRDGGATWKQGYLPGHPGDTRTSILTGYTACGDAAIAFAPDGTVYYAGIAFQRASSTTSVARYATGGAGVSVPPALFIAKSTDGGDTWTVSVPQRGVGASVSVSTPVAPLGGGVQLFNDKEFIAVGPDGTVYVTWTKFFFSPVSGEAPIAFIKSIDGGDSWSDPVVISRTNSNQGSVPVVAPDGTITVAWGEFGSDAMKVVVRSSSDKGASWGEVVEVASTINLDGTHRTRANSFPSIAVDPASSPTPGRLTTVWAGKSTEDGDSDAFLSQSLDAGKTWTAPVRLNQDPVGNGRDQFFAWVAADGIGGVHVVYFDARDDPRNQHLAVYVADTIDGSVIRERPVTDAPFLADADGFTNDNFLGDYLAITASPLGVHPLWPDTRTAMNELGDTDLYTVRLMPTAAP